MRRSSPLARDLPTTGPTYDGPNTLEGCIEYLKQLFLKQMKPGGLPCYVHATTVITRQSRRLPDLARAHRPSVLSYAGDRHK